MPIAPLWSVFFFIMVILLGLDSEVRVTNHNDFIWLFFSPWVILHNFFIFLLIYGGLGFWGLGLRLGFWGLGFSVDGVWGLWCRASRYFGLRLSKLA
mgnify:CR=1 FL=1